MNKENFVKTLLQSNAIKSENVDERVLGYIPLKGKWELRFAAYGGTLYLDKTTFIRPYIGNTISLIMSKKLMSNTNHPVAYDMLLKNRNIK